MIISSNLNLTDAMSPAPLAWGPGAAFPPSFLRFYLWSVILPSWAGQSRGRGHICLTGIIANYSSVTNRPLPAAAARPRGYAKGSQREARASLFISPRGTGLLLAPGRDRRGPFNVFAELQSTLLPQ